MIVYDKGEDLRGCMHLCRALKQIVDEGKLNAVYNVAAGNPSPFSPVLEIARGDLGSQSKCAFLETLRFYQ